MLLQQFQVDIHILETYAVWTLEQAYENVGFTTIQRAANDRAYSTRQHFAVLALLRCFPSFAISRHNL